MRQIDDFPLPHRRQRGARAGTEALGLTLWARDPVKADIGAAVSALEG